MLGKKHSDATKRRIKRAMNNYWAEHKDERIEENKGVYGSTAGTVVSNDHDLVKTSEYLKNLQEAEQARKGIKKNVEQS
jgi:hypothetical protein